MKMINFFISVTPFGDSVENQSSITLTSTHEQSRPKFIIPPRYFYDGSRVMMCYNQG